MDTPHDPDTLDPHDWEGLRRLGHRMVDASLAALRDVREKGAWRPTPAALHERFRSPLPRRGEGAEAAWQAFERDVAPWPLGATHPRFWGWVAGDGTPIAALAGLLAAADHSSVAGFDCAATLVEEQTVAWLRELLGFSADGFGLLTSGASHANLTGLAIARHVMAEHDVNAEGAAAAPRPLTVYASRETHGSVRRALELMGMGREALRAVPIDERRRMRTDELARAIAADRAAGRLPAVVVGNAGTVSTGAVDDLDALADVCARERLWFHVDGAIGAPAWLAEEGRAVLAGMQRADSLAFDLHKWLFMPFGTGCILFRSEREAHAAFADGASYLKPTAGGPRGHARWLGDLGLELTRPNRALPVWMALRAHGADGFARAIAKNLAQARHFARRIAAEPELELAAPVMLNVVAFRYVPRDGRGDAEVDALNTDLAVRVQESGAGVPSTTSVDGRFALRVAITNHRSRVEDFDAFTDALLAEGRALAAETAHAGRGTGGAR